MATTTPSNFTITLPSLSLPSHHPKPPQLLHSPKLTPHSLPQSLSYSHVPIKPFKNTACKAAADVSVESGTNWVPVIPLSALPKGERRVVIQDGEAILLLWYKGDVFAVENKSPAEGAYSEGLINAKLTQDGCIVCPTTDSTYDLRTGAVRDWYPKNPVLRVLTPSLRSLYIYPLKTDDENIYIGMEGDAITDASAEIVFSGRSQPGVTASDVNVDEVRMIIDDGQEGLGFTKKNELINGKAAVIGFLLLLDFELLTGEGLLKGTGFLDFLYSASHGFK